MTKEAAVFVDQMERALGGIAQCVGIVHLPAGNVQAVSRLAGSMSPAVYTLGGHRYIKKYNAQIRKWIGPELIVETDSEGVAVSAAGILFDVLQAMDGMGGDIVFPSVISIFNPSCDEDMVNRDVLIVEYEKLNENISQTLLEEFGVFILRVILLTAKESEIYYRDGLRQLLNRVGQLGLDLNSSARFGV